MIRSQALYPVELRVHFYAEDRNRTDTEKTLRRILSPVRLPVPPPRQKMFHKLYYMRVKGFEPPRPKALDPKSSASASSATPAS